MKQTKKLALTAVMAALTAAGAWVRIPAPPSSFTLQVFFTAMAGILLGPRCGAASQGLYVLLGLIGLPVFTGGGGPMYVVQPTFGFLLGLIPMAAVTGRLARPGAGFRRLLLASAAGLAVLYAVGLPYLYLVMKLYLRAPWTVGQTVVSGMAVFLPWDAVKLAAAGLLGVRLAPLAAQCRRAAAAASTASAPKTARNTKTIR